ncbi:MAG TPA: selenocysteine-specific translation elongation factor [Porticoccaceae bacterium]|jgi:selenocysteine-specific elongation factor|nr:selenocysteine-specific translation elongation factor [Gammaproteobacteria bacterium]HIL59210.1 selenocysteine-specific translation elongation factor [Porticoccaceae bacterium]
MSNSDIRSLTLATAGHVDHGKTSLVSNITNKDTDSLAEEKARGLTINLGYAYHHFSDSEGNNNIVGFVDVPGHTDFINNMLAGVSSVDAALLVVAADDGIMPQTKEHLAILDLLEIPRGVIALTKVDRCDDERIAAVIQEIKDLIRPTSLADSCIFPISNQSKAGIPPLIQHLEELLTSSNLSDSKNTLNCFRYLIDRSFSVKGIGTVVTGSVRAGYATTAQQVLHTNSDQSTRLRSLMQDTFELDSCHKGQRIAANITLSHGDISRGDWLTGADQCFPVNRFDARIKFINEQQKINSSAQYHLYIGGSHRIVSIRALGDGIQNFYQIRCHQSIIGHYGDRFILRDPASQNTIGGGRVIDIFVPRKKRDSEPRLALLLAMDQEAEQALDKLLSLRAEGVNLDQFAVNRNLTEEAIQKLRDNLKTGDAGPAVISVNKRKHPLLLHQKYFEQYSQLILKTVKEFHSMQSSQQGISEPALSRATNFKGSHLLFHNLLQHLIDSAEIKRTGTLLHLVAHVAQMSDEENNFLNKIRPILQKTGNVPPRTRELEEMTNIPLKPLERILKQTTLAGNLIQVAPNRYYLPDTIMDLAEITEKLIQQYNSDEGFSVIQFRDKTGIGRNLCIEILEYFDRVGFTRRDGNSRFVRTEKENIFGK